MGDSGLTIGVFHELFDALKQELQPLGVELVMALDVNDGLRRFAKVPFQLVVLDLGAVSGDSHLEVVTALRSLRTRWAAEKNTSAVSPRRYPTFGKLLS